MSGFRHGDRGFSNYIEIYRLAPSVEISCKLLITAYNSGSEPQITRAFENFVTSVIGSNC